ncbi:LAMI_0C04170g1_1 [Lachancea mirantina]|uniref:LAMI_0C04170g1_1 n=1 Tax=Lachancea mirantina TaxID=1230905 RepID=A0A1G4J2L3_9SACH|nr:LAMI_0C04170g1_1 [Lachancea mirantina]
MVDFGNVPGPVKAIFNKFPLQMYPPVASDYEDFEGDESMRRSYFEGQNAVQTSGADTFALGVYNVFEHGDTSRLLASDPWCLFTQLALCRKSRLKLGTRAGLGGAQRTKQSTKQSTAPQHSMVTLSPLAAVDASLPVLIEGSSRRFVRSTEGINEILRSRIKDCEDVVYAALWDSVVYDAWIAETVFGAPRDHVLRTYAFDYKANGAVLSYVSRRNVTMALLKRNGFELRHAALSRYADSPAGPMAGPMAGPVAGLLDPIVENAQRTLQQFESLLADDEQTFFSSSDSAGMLDLKVASYTTCLLHCASSESRLAEYLRRRCPQLVAHSLLVVQQYC